ncbi:hypothetical protein BT69DRAFT_1194251, partial [Atractiella rhizophila]
PEKFRKAVRIDPISFQKLLKAIKHHPIFQNKSHNPQSPVRYQLAVLLHRLGHYGNAESLDSLSAIFGCSTGMIELCCFRVITAILLMPSLAKQSVFWPRPSSRKKYKEMAKEIAGGCEEWKGGWCMVDGTLINMFQKPHMAGDTWYGRKSTY